MPPTNDDFANAIDLSTAGGTTTFSNVGATMETGEPDNAEGHSVWFKITLPSEKIVTVRTGDTPLPDWDSYLSVLTGAAVSALTEITNDDDSDLQPGHTDSFGTSKVTWDAAAGTTYYVQVTAWDDVSGPVERSDLQLTWTVTALPPHITSFTPTFGFVGDAVTVTGTNFTGADAVTICGASAAFTVDSDTQITATVPNGAAGVGAITVHTAGGTGSLGGFTPRYDGPWITPDPFWHDFDPVLARTTQSHGTGSTDADAEVQSWFDEGTETTTGVQPITVGTANNGDHTFDAWQGHYAGPAVNNPVGVTAWPEVPGAFPPDAVDYEFDGTAGTVLDWHVVATLDSITGAQTDRGFIFKWNVVLDWQLPADIQTFYTETSSPDYTGQLGLPNEVLVPGTVSAGYTVTWQPDMTYWYPNGFHDIPFSIYPERMRDFPTVESVGELVATWSVQDLFYVQLPRYRWIYDRPQTTGWHVGVIAMN